MGDAPKTYGRCPVCDRWYRLRADGMMRNHGDGQSFPPRSCNGWGQVPTEVQDR